MKILALFNKKNKNIFTNIYRNNMWKSSESVSGNGSTIEETKILVEELNRLFKRLRITSILDIPCGDFNWMKNVDLFDIDYLGADIVSDLVKENLINYRKSNIYFKVLDLITDRLPKKDLIIVRDCLVHLSYENIYAAVKNIRESGCKYP